MISEQLSNTIIASYQLTHKLGEGGMGTVYLAIRISDQQQVAIKILKTEDSADGSAQQARFKREAKTASSLTHPNIVSIFEYGIEGQNHYVAMPLLKGGTLDERYHNSRKNNLPPPALQETTFVIGQIASALDYAHQRGIIHRDIKPSNILFDGDGNAYLTDFGIAHVQSANTQLTSTGTMIGTPQYMPPEQWRSEKILTQATDQYALAVVSYQLISGQLPFHGENAPSLMHAHIYDAPPRIHTIKTDLHPDLSFVLDKALAKQAELRYPSVGEFFEAFKVASEKLPSELPTGFFQTMIEQPPMPLPTSVPSKVEEKPVSVMTTMVKTVSSGRGFVGLLLIALIIGGFSLVFLSNSSTVQPGGAVGLEPSPNIPTISEDDLSATTDQISSMTAIAMALTDDAGATQTFIIQQTATQIEMLIQTSTALAWTDTPSPTPSQTLTFTPSVTFTSTFTPTSTHTFTPTLTSTFTPTSTYTDTPTNTATNTPTYTFTPTPTSTHTLTPTLTSTLTPSYTPTATFTPTLDATDTPESGFHSGTYNIGREVQVANIDNRFPIRTNPSFGATIITTIERATLATIIDGPTDVSELLNGLQHDYRWWKIETEGGSVGWVQETYNGEPVLFLTSDNESLEPVTCRLTTFGDVNIRNAPNTGGEIVASRRGAGNVFGANGQAGTISDPKNHWWQLWEGFWIRNDQVSEDGDCANLPRVN